MDQNVELCRKQMRIVKLISHDHAKISHSHAKCSRKAKLVLMHFLLRTLTRNCWSSCEIASFPYFLMKKPPEDLLDDVQCPLDLSL